MTSVPWTEGGQTIPTAGGFYFGKSLDAQNEKGGGQKVKKLRKAGVHVLVLLLFLGGKHAEHAVSHHKATDHIDGGENNGEDPKKGCR